MLNKSIEVKGVKIYGSRWKDLQTKKGMQDEYAKKDFSDIPQDVDIVIVHQPPQGILDTIWTGISRGNPALRERVVQVVKPMVCIFGHNHNQYGNLVIDDCCTTFINATSVNGKPRQQDMNKPVIFRIYS
jgi:Icc-related predicted phosphoesterase